MGMAASQARFLNLTARKTNIEYQGQQINQQRTELSNESANLYNQMLTLQVPVPPNTQDYTRVEYSFIIPGSYDTQATVTQFAKGNDGTYTVLFTYSEKELGFPACTTKQRTDLTNTSVTSDTYAIYTYPDLTTQLRRKDATNFQYLNASNEWKDATVTPYNTKPGAEPELSAWNQMGCDASDTSKRLYKVVMNGTTQFFTSEQINSLGTGTPGPAQTLQAYEGKNLTADNYSGGSITTYNGKTAKLSYVDSKDSLHKDAYDRLSNNGADNIWVANVGTDEKPVYQYYKTSDIKAAKASTGDDHVVYYSASEVTNFVEDSYKGVTISRDGNNRVQSFNYGGEDYPISANTITDDEAYNQAMNEYTYQSYLYEQEMNNINAKTSIVHAQDRELELKLKQLDTEHNAVQTEIDTVKQISKKNVEDSFKTFA